MKKSIILGLGIALIFGGITSCKKGENDPFVSLKSRKARVVGEWTVNSSELTRTWQESNQQGGGTETYKYDGTTETVYIQNNGSSISETNKYTLDYTFEKDGSYKQVHTNTEDNSVTTITGNWSFLGKSKEADLKNKEAIILTVSSTTTTGPNPSSTTETGLIRGNVLLIDQLKSKEMIIKTDYSGTGSDGYSFTEIGNMVFIAK